MQIDVTFALDGWDEKTWTGEPALEIEGEKLTRATVTQTYAGELQGNSRLEYAMYYRADKTGVFVALEHFEGALAGRKGNLVLQYNGTFDDTRVRGICTIVPGSGTDELAGVRGSGVLELAGHQERYPFLLTYEWD